MIDSELDVSRTASIASRLSWMTLAMVVLVPLLSPAQTLSDVSNSDTRPSWSFGAIVDAEEGTVEYPVKTWPDNGRFNLTAPFPNVSAVFLKSGEIHTPLEWTLSSDSTRLEIRGNSSAPTGLPISILLETVEASQQFTDGRITFSALDSQIAGQQAQLETQPGNHRVGFWTQPNDSVTWPQYKPTRWGWYDVELTYSAAGGPGTEVAVHIADVSFTLVRPPTGSWYNYRTATLGRLFLHDTQAFDVRVSCPTLQGGAVINLKAVTLRPTREGPGASVVSGDVIRLGAETAIVRGTTLRYEPQPQKLCLGYWSQVRDRAEWIFSTESAQNYEMVLWQGCGRGHGGSDVAVSVGGQTHRFVVEETGHFQNFIPRSLGKIHLPIGTHRLVVQPEKKPGGAVMDIQQIQLVPIRPSNHVSPVEARVLESRPVVFLGDSITWAGEWVVLAETYLRLRHPGIHLDFINLGLPSETVSGLSEPGHAAGSFPRPVLSERLERVLEQTRPSLLVVCYGMNDGIYHPLNSERFERFQAGLMQLREMATQRGIPVIHLTPPPFDAHPIRAQTLPAGQAAYTKPYVGYDEVLKAYSKWMLERRNGGWDVVDIHTPINDFIRAKRISDPDFRLAGDGVHLNSQGQWLMAREFLRFVLGAEVPAPTEAGQDPLRDALSADDSKVWLDQMDGGSTTLGKVRERQQLLRDAWLASVGHERPGMSAGKPLVKAQTEASRRAAEIIRLNGKTED